MTRGLAFGFLGYALFTVGDALVKAVGPGISPFQIAFAVSALASVAIVVTKPKDERWRDALRMRRPRLVMARAVLASITWVAGIHAFTTIPFAEAFALIFLAPSLVAILSRLVLGERPGPLGWASIVVGFLGVLVAIRPGFRELGTGHLGAAICAIGVAASIVVLRRLTAVESRTTIMVVTNLWIILVTGIAMIPVFRWPSGAEAVWLVLSGILDGFGQICLLLATRNAAAALVGATHYSQLIWAVAIGAAFFAEWPDAWMLLGLAAIAASGLLAVAAARAPGRMSNAG
ncbi:MAG: DMT family transporter [Alphaproteobacteria bacterium]|nr:DMT family transporter [Alphaproteobacteria bacterium]